MKVSYNWLQEYIEEKLPTVEDVVEALTMHSFEIEGVEEKGDDKILDIKVLPNRTHDCLSHYGIAKELASVLGFSVRWTIPNQPFPNFDGIKLKISTKSCSRALMVLIKDVKINQSPKWLKEKLGVMGQKPINSIVDITNYLTYAYGQPMHAFDADKVSTDYHGNYDMDIRQAKAGEKITLLNDNEYTLSEHNMVISDNKKALDVAGVMGGKDASVSSNTKDIILSLSSFDAVSVRKTSKSIGIRTDASQRFENEISPSLVDRALPFALKLISELAEGKFVGAVDIYPEKIKEKTIVVTAKKISSILGVNIDIPTMIFLLGKQKITSVKDGESIKITIPDDRLDLEIEENIAEEIGRLYGYDKIPTKELEGILDVNINKDIYISNQIRKLLTENGFSEIYTYAFVSKGDIEIENPLASDKKFLRSNLSSAMEFSLEQNFKFVDLLGFKEVKLFEIGKVFSADSESLYLSLGAKYPKKGGSGDEEIARTIGLLEKSLRISVGDISIVGGIAEINVSEFMKDIKIPNKYPEDFWKTEDKNVVYKTISPYPFAVRDVAVFVPNSVEQGRVEELVKEKFTNIVVRFSLFDKFSKEDKTSYAYRLVFQSPEKTLTDTEINKVMDSIYETLKFQEGFEIR